MYVRCLNNEIIGRIYMLRSLLIYTGNLGGPLYITIKDMVIGLKYPVF
jgi:hypothetical protein